MSSNTSNKWMKPTHPIPLGGVIFATKYDTWLGAVPVPGTPNAGVFDDGRICSGKKRPMIIVGHTDSVMICVPIISNPAITTEMIAVAPTHPNDAKKVTGTKPILQWENPDHNDASFPGTWDTPAWCHFTQLCTVRYNEFYKIYSHQLDEKSTRALITGIQNYCIPLPKKAPAPEPPVSEQV
jgi:hypothetical protein